MFFCAWHFPTLKTEYHTFFEQSATEKMTTPLANLSIYLMICALGIMMRASQKEIFGSVPQGKVELRKEEVDLTCSRLQSELYRESRRQPEATDSEAQTRKPPSHSLWSLSSSPTLLLPVLTEHLDSHSPGPHRYLPTQLGARQ